MKRQYYYMSFISLMSVEIFISRKVINMLISWQKILHSNSHTFFNAVNGQLNILSFVLHGPYLWI